MKQKSKLLAALLACSLCLCSFTLASGPQETQDNTQQISTAYTFQVVPGTTAWNAMEDSREKVAACYIPQQIIENMTTEALLETVLDYPLLIDIFAYDTTNMGIELASTYLPGIPELLSREDALEVLGKYIEDYPGQSSDIKYQYCKAFVRYLLPAPLIAPRYITYSVKTPNNSTVYVYSFTGWEDYRLYSTNTEADVQKQQREFIDRYNPTLLRQYTYKYNCHSYAWYSQNTSNSYWMEDPYAYMTDGSYSYGSASVGARIVYKEGSTTIHSGIVTSKASTYPTITSKWGASGLFSHASNNCPYYNAATACTYYN